MTVGCRVAVAVRIGRRRSNGRSNAARAVRGRVSCLGLTELG